ncbi:MAG: carboxypeptidase regulatory-like domain-containing protein, partial [Deltaproteobacteria bacterium]|nr:carboxypeptidase regulatory-like domain-containing protein [Deltaproteobacteria bacterium]
MDLAKDLSPRFSWFVLGHLAHLNSDNLCESFMTGTVFGSAPIGMFDLLDNQMTPRGESEDIVETYGDLITGDWDAFVDMLFDFWFDGEVAKDRAREIILWYFEAGADYYNKDSDCAAALADLESKLDSAEKYIGGFTREQDKELFANLTSQPLEDLVDLFTAGTVQSLLGDQAGLTPWVKEEVQRFKKTALVDPDFWLLYDDQLSMLGPTWTLARLTGNPLAAWPAWDANAMISGNIQSVMQFDPDEYAVIPGLLVDLVEWREAGGGAVSKATADMNGEPASVRVRFFSSLPFEGKITGVVKKDRPGFDANLDEVLGAADLDVSIDPLEYVGGDRSLLEIPFTVDLDGAMGFYVELFSEGSDLPFFTTSWDRLWTGADQIDLERPMYRDFFGTYGHWPPSLPVAEPEAKPSVLFVKVRLAPAGAGLPGVVVTVQEDGDSSITGANGLAVFSNLTEGTWTVDAKAEGYSSEGEVSATLGPLDESWIDLPLHAVPRVTGPGEFWSNRTCMPFDWDVAPFGAQAAGFTAWMEVKDREAPPKEINVGLSGESIVCVKPPARDGDLLRVGVKAEYVDDTWGVEGFSSWVSIDGSPPVVSRAEAGVHGNPPCLQDPGMVPYLPPVDVVVDFEEPNSPLTAVHWRAGERGWQEAQWTLTDKGGGVGEVTFPLALDGGSAGSSLRVRLTNGSGMQAVTGPISLPVWGESHLCVQPTPDEAVDAWAPPE